MYGRIINSSIDVFELMGTPVSLHTTDRGAAEEALRRHDE